MFHGELQLPDHIQSSGKANNLLKLAFVGLSVRNLYIYIYKDYWVYVNGTLPRSN